MAQVTDGHVVKGGIGNLRDGKGPGLVMVGDGHGPGFRGLKLYVPPATVLHTVTRKRVDISYTLCACTAIYV